MMIKKTIDVERVRNALNTVTRAYTGAVALPNAAEAFWEDVISGLEYALLAEEATHGVKVCFSNDAPQPATQAPWEFRDTVMTREEALRLVCTFPDIPGAFEACDAETAKRKTLIKAWETLGL